MFKPFFVILISVLSATSTQAFQISVPSDWTLPTSIPISPLSVNPYGSAWLCDSCGNPNTPQGLQNIANKAHNLAWGASKQKIIRRGGSSMHAGTAPWHDLRISSSGQTVSVSFDPSVKTQIAMALGSVSQTITLRVEFGTGKIRYVDVIYRPGYNYPIVFDTVSLVVSQASWNFGGITGNFPSSSDYAASLSFNFADFSFLGDNWIPYVITEELRPCRSVPGDGSACM